MGIDSANGEQGQDFVAPLTPEQRLAANTAAAAMLEEEYPQSEEAERSGRTHGFYDNKAIARNADLLVNPNERGLAIVESFRQDVEAERLNNPTVTPRSQGILNDLNSFSTVAEQVEHIQKFFPGKYEDDLAA